MSITFGDFHKNLRWQIEKLNVIAALNQSSKPNLLWSPNQLATTPRGFQV